MSPLKRAFLVLFLIFTHSLTAALGYFSLYREKTGVALIVNGETADKARLASTLTLYRDEALRNLAIEMAVTQAAQRKHIELTHAEANPAWAEKLDPELAKARLAQYRGELLFRKLVISQTTEKERKTLYDNFKDQLAIYNIRRVRLADGTDMARLRDDMKRNRPAKELERAYGAFGQKPLEEALTVSELRLLVGSKDFRKATEAKPGQLIGPLPSLTGPILLEVTSKRDDFESVQANIDDIIFKAKTRLYSVELGAESFVSSPFSSVPAGTSPSTSATPTPDQTDPLKLTHPVQPKELPKPTSHPTTGLPGALPLPSSTPLGEMPVMPAPTSSGVPGPQELPDLKPTPGLKPRVFIPASSATP